MEHQRLKANSTGRPKGRHKHHITITIHQQLIDLQASRAGNRHNQTSSNEPETHQRPDEPITTAQMKLLPHKVK